MIPSGLTLASQSAHVHIVEHFTPGCSMRYMGALVNLYFNARADISIVRRPP